MLTALASSLPIGFVDSAAASPLNPDQTIIRQPGQLQWKSNPAFPEPSVDSCLLSGDTNQSGLYYTLVRWWAGFHERATQLHDRPVLRRRVGHMVVQQRSRFRTDRMCSGARRELRPSGRQNAALRRGHPRPSRACRHCNLRNRAGELRAQRSLSTGRATDLRPVKPLLLSIILYGCVLSRAPGRLGAKT